MAIHPARVVASVLLVAGSAFVSVMVLGIVIAKLLVNAGIAVSPPTLCCWLTWSRSSRSSSSSPPPVSLAAAGLVRGKRWSDDLAFGTAIAAVAIGRRRVDPAERRA